MSPSDCYLHDMYTENTVFELQVKFPPEAYCFVCIACLEEARTRLPVAPDDFCHSCFSPVLSLHLILKSFIYHILQGTYELSNGAQRSYIVIDQWISQRKVQYSPYANILFSRPQCLQNLCMCLLKNKRGEKVNMIAWLRRVGLIFRGKLCLASV